ncbi:LytTR family transcriptional regulator [Caulobacter sp. 17J80-11]|nr:LytTR family transcriptional regulator [Caulobacter sp. 17J80-11]
MIGAFGLFVTGPWPERLLYWSRTVLAGYVLQRPLIRLGAGVAVRLGRSEAVGWAAAVLVGTVPMTFWLWWLGPTIDLARPWPDDLAFLQTYAQALPIGALGWSLMWFLAGRSLAADVEPTETPAPAPETEASVEPAAGARLLERLPARLGREVIALGMEDHYVRVFTRRGDTLVLMRMADAVAELAAVDGAQVHRSWWVARAAVVASERRGRSGVLRLDTGLEVPVARRRLAELKALGWA